MIAARVAALATARGVFPEVFNDQHPALPEDIGRRLRDAVGDGKAAQAAIEWWVSRPAYRRARQARLRRPPASAEECAATLAIVQRLVPDVFDVANPRPLAIGVRDQVVALGIAPADANAFLGFWTKRSEYRAAIVKGGNRHNVDGTIAGVIGNDRADAAVPVAQT